MAKFFVLNATEPLGIPITSVGDGVSGPDLRTATAASISALKPDGLTTVTWIPSIVPADGQSSILATLAKLVYPFNGTELDTKGPWRLSWVLTLSGTPSTWQEAPEDTTVIVVVDRYGRQ